MDALSSPASASVSAPTCIPHHLQRPHQQQAATVPPKRPPRNAQTLYDTPLSSPRLPPLPTSAPEYRDLTGLGLSQYQVDAFELDPDATVRAPKPTLRSASFSTTTEPGFTTAARNAPWAGPKAQRRLASPVSFAPVVSEPPAAAPATSSSTSRSTREPTSSVSGWNLPSLVLGTLRGRSVPPPPTVIPASPPQPGSPSSPHKSRPRRPRLLRSGSSTSVFSSASAPSPSGATSPQTPLGTFSSAFATPQTQPSAAAAVQQQPRKPHHPFLTDQSPYIARRESSNSLRSFKSSSSATSGGGSAVFERNEPMARLDEIGRLERSAEFQRRLGVEPGGGQRREREREDMWTNSSLTSSPAASPLMPSSGHDSPTVPFRHKPGAQSMSSTTSSLSGSIPLFRKRSIRKVPSASVLNSGGGSPNSLSLPLGPLPPPPPRHANGAARPNLRASSASSSSASSASSANSLATTTPSSPENSPTTPIDRRCLTWMREAELHNYYFGSVAARGGISPEERGARRDILAQMAKMEISEGVEVLEEEEGCAMRATGRHGQRL